MHHRRMPDGRALAGYFRLLNGFELGWKCIHRTTLPFLIHGFPDTPHPPFMFSIIFPGVRSLPNVRYLGVLGYLQYTTPYLRHFHTLDPA